MRYRESSRLITFNPGDMCGYAVQVNSISQLGVYIEAMEANRLKWTRGDEGKCLAEVLTFFNKAQRNCVKVYPFTSHVVLVPMANKTMLMDCYEFSEFDWEKSIHEAKEYMCSK